METSSSGSSELLSAYLRLSDVLRRVPLFALELPENISAHRLRTVLGYGLLYFMILNRSLAVDEC